MARKAIIMGAGGRDFHNFNVYFRNNPYYEVVAFTATQIPYIEYRHYPPELSGPYYPEGIPIYPEADLPELIRRLGVSDVFFSYSDVSNQYVMEKSALVNSAGATFHLLGPNDTMIKSLKPVIAVVATRTGAGKSPVSRYISRILREKHLSVGIIRHPMAYGDFKIHRAMELSSIEDLDRYQLTIEEKEDYEPHILNGFTVYSGIDYEEVLEMAEKKSDVILWDGGNNDYPFIKPDIYITVADPYRWRHIETYYPSGINIRLADIVVVTKVNTASRDDINNCHMLIKKLNPKATVVYAGIKGMADIKMDLSGKKVLVIEDGPTTTHGEMPYGMGYLYAVENECEIIDPRPYAGGSIKEMYNKYPHIDKVLPAVGYSVEQIKELEEVINTAPVDYVISATPTNLGRYLDIDKEIISVRYELVDIDEQLKSLVEEYLSKVTEKVK
jgi:predicted GTPase